MTIEEMIADLEKSVEQHEVIKNQMSEIFRKLTTVKDHIYHCDHGVSATLAMLYESLNRSASQFNTVLYRETSEILEKRDTLKELTDADYDYTHDT